MYLSYMDTIAVQKLKIYSKFFARTFNVFKKNWKECRRFVLNTIIWHNVNKKVKGAELFSANLSSALPTFLKNKVLEAQNSYS